MGSAESQTSVGVADVPVNTMASRSASLRRSAPNSHDLTLVQNGVSSRCRGNNWPGQNPFQWRSCLFMFEISQILFWMPELPQECWIGWYAGYVRLNICCLGYNSLKRGMLLPALQLWEQQAAETKGVFFHSFSDDFLAFLVFPERGRWDMEPIGAGCRRAECGSSAFPHRLPIQITPFALWKRMGE